MAMGRDGWQWPLLIRTKVVLLVFFFFGLSYFIFNLQTNGLEKFGRPLQKMNVTIVKGEI